MTDDRVWVDQDGREMIAANRSDGMGLGRLRTLTDIQGLRDLQRIQPGGGRPLPQAEDRFHAGHPDKATVLKKVLDEKQLSGDEVVYSATITTTCRAFRWLGMQSCRRMRWRT
jgi:3-deoxy-D-manno-octulosonate 8-phosphate phosphatase KdsC-like HAD superfamily phosphatase